MTRAARRAAAALLSGVVVAASMLVAAPSATAMGQCSVVLPTRVSVVAPYNRVTAHLASDCAGADKDYASWDITHTYYGDDGILIFDTGETTDLWEIYDWDHVGTYLIEPSSAWDSDYNDLSQNSVQVSVRRGSRLSVSSSRSGKYVTVRSTATRYSPSAQTFRPWASKTVRLQYRTCATCAWKPLRSKTSNRYGKVSYRYYSPRAKYFRAVTADESGTWGRTSGTTRR